MSEDVFSGSYAPEDVRFLMARRALDWTGIEEKERLIQSGRRHYSEMLSREEPPPPELMDAYHRAMAREGPRLAREIEALAGALAERHGDRGVALVSLARAGTPIGVLLRRALSRRGVATEHSSISIVRDRGLDLSALAEVRATAGDSAVIFVDGWTGKGAIAAELRGPRGSLALGVEPFLVVVADPAGQADLAGSLEDWVIPCGLLNGVISGLVSRSVLEAGAAAGARHGCVVLDHLRPHDLTRAFVDQVDAWARSLGPVDPAHPASPEALNERRRACARLLRRIAQLEGVADPNRIKPGAAEATRALLRRAPHVLCLPTAKDPDTEHLEALCARRGTPVRRLDDLGGWRAVAVIADLGEG